MAIKSGIIINNVNNIEGLKSQYSSPPENITIQTSFFFSKCIFNK